MSEIIVNGCLLDDQQKSVIWNKSKRLLVVAGAGSGKTLTILGKVQHLIQEEKVPPEDILCLSFTKESVNHLKEKLQIPQVDVLTFHKLGLCLLQESRREVMICKSDTLKYVIDEFLYGFLWEEKIMMQEVLRYLSLPLSFLNTKKRYERQLKKKKSSILSLEESLLRFIQLFKTNNYSLDAFIDFKKRAFSRKEKAFLSIACNIYLIYQNELKSSGFVDFDDVLIEAREEVKIRGIKKKYQYVIIDEYQDTSLVRQLLIEQILDYTGAKLMAVGDDFQSIYRFTGCNLQLFTNFQSFFSSSEILKLEKTYRNSQELICVAGNFVMKNPKQIPKKLQSDLHCNFPIVLCYYNHLEEKVSQILDSLSGTVMILGRNNFDIDSILGSQIFRQTKDVIIYKKKPALSIRFLTVHRAKGLESDYVIVLNLLNTALGFPSKKQDDIMLRFVSIRDQIPNEEERRLFYVALTRAKKKVYLLTKRYQESPFVKEILKQYANYVEIQK